MSDNIKLFEKIVKKIKTLEESVSLKNPTTLSIDGNFLVLTNDYGTQERFDLSLSKFKTIDKISVDEENRLVFTYGDGSQILTNPVNTIRGQDGRDGEIGPRGIAGKNGEKGEKGDKGDKGATISDIEYNSENGVLSILLDDGKIFNLENIKGLRGERGEDGRDGKDGKDGRDGRDGKDGKDGERGPPGKSEDLSEVKKTIKQTSKKIETLEEEIKNVKVIASRKPPQNINSGGGGAVRLKDQIDVQFSDATPINHVLYHVGNGVFGFKADSTGTGSVTQYRHDQVSTALQWTVNHNLGVYPSFITVFSVGGVPVEADIVNINENQLVVNFVIPYNGYVIVM